MKKKFLILTFGLFLIFLVAISFAFFYNFSQAPISQASVANNVYGYAWSSNIGWINLNNCDDLTLPAPDCPDPQFGVNIDPVTGNLTGYAWSNNIGWLSFNDSDAAHPQARLDLDPMSPTFNQISGWARFLSQGDNWDGWIKLRDANYGVSRNGCNIEGFAWGDLVAGWIYFYTETTLCGPAVNNPPSATLDAPFMSVPCPPSLVTVSFSWTYNDADGDPESRFDFRVNDVNNVNDPNPEVDRTFSGLNNPDGTANNQLVKVVASPQNDKILFNQTYRWWTRVWDEPGDNSGWVYGGSIDTPTNPPPDPSFECSLGPLFDWTSDCNSLGAITNETVHFRNTNAGYDYYGWDFDYDGSFDPDLSNQGQVEWTFTEAREYVVRHRVTDYQGTADEITCDGSQTLDIYGQLPEWREIPPT